MNTQALILEVYAAFNRRDVDSVLAMMSEDVSWPKASEGGRVEGRKAIRDYRTRQWADFDPHVEVLAVIELEDSRTKVKVRQMVRSVAGEILSDTEVRHVYTLQNDLIKRMDILEADGNTEGRSAAFVVHRS